MRLLACAALLACASAAGCGGPKSLPPTAFLPLERGKVFHYGTAPGGKRETIHVETDPASPNIWSLNFSATAAGKMVWLLRQDGSGLSLAGMAVGSGSTMIQPPLLLLPNPVVEGTPWSSRESLPTADPSRPSPAYAVEGAAKSTELPVGGKTYKARQVTLRISLGPAHPEAKYVLWIAPTIGIVRYQGGTVEPGPKSGWPADAWDLVEIQKKP